MRRLALGALVAFWLGGLAVLAGGARWPHPLASSTGRPHGEATRAWRPVGGGWLGQPEGLLALVDERSLHVSGLREVAPGVRFGAATVTVGARRLGGAPSMSARGDFVDVDRRDYVEQYRCHPDGVELRWAFDAPLEGPLQVDVPIEGARGATVEARGLRLGSLWLGHGTWVDADGRRTPVPVAWEGGTARWLVPAGVLARSRFPAVLDPLIRPEHELDERLVYAGNHSQPVTAVSGTLALVVWIDEGPQSSAVKGALVDLTATPPTVTALTLRPAQAQRTQRHPAAAATATGWVVVWEEADPISRNAEDIIGVSLSRAGMPVSGPSALSVAGSQVQPAVAFTGSQGIVVWVENDGLRLLGIDETLSPAGSSVPLAAGAGVKRAPAAAAGPQGYFVAWEDDANEGDIRGTQLGPDRAQRASAVVVAGQAGRQWSPTVAALGPDWLVAWVEDRMMLNDDVRAAIVSAADGGVIRTSMPVAPSIREQAAPSLSSLSTGNVLLLYEENLSTTGKDLFAVTVGPGLTTGGRFDVIRLGADQRSPHVSASSLGIFAVWEDTRPAVNAAESRVFGTGLALDGGVVTRSGVVLSTVANTQKQPDVAFADEGALVVWEDDRSTTPAVVAALVSAEGEALGAPIPLAPPLAPQFSPRVAWNGSSFLVVYEADSTGGLAVDAVLVARNGMPGVPVRVAAPAPGRRSPALAAVGRDVLVTWVEPGGNAARVMVQALDETGRLVGTARTVSQGLVGIRATPAIASDGTGARIVWVDERTGLTELRSATVSTPRALTILDQDHVVSTSTTSASRSETPSLTWAGTHYVLLWAEGQDVRSAVVAARGAAMVPGQVLASGPPRQWAPALAKTRATVLAVWQSGLDRNASVIAQRLFADAGVMMGLRNRGRVGAIMLKNEQTPRVACDDRGRCLAVYVVDDDSPDVRTKRAWVTPLEPNSPPVAEDFEMQAVVGRPEAIPYQAWVEDLDGEQPRLVVTRAPTRGGVDGGFYTASSAGLDSFQVVALDAFDEASAPAEVVVNVTAPDGGSGGGGGGAGGGAGGGDAQAGGGAGGAQPELDGGTTPSTVVFVPACGCASGEGVVLFALVGWHRRRRSGGATSR